jgi:hypothetical protein
MSLNLTRLNCRIYIQLSKSHIRSVKRALGGARRRIFELYLRRHMIEVPGGHIDNCMPQLSPDAYDDQQRAP